MFYCVPFLGYAEIFPFINFLETSDCGLSTELSDWMCWPTLECYQVGGTTDNIEESCATFASRALDLPEPLKTTHQIDNCTEGWYCPVKAFSCFEVC